MVVSDKMIRWRTSFHKALSNPVRLQIIELLMDGEKCQCEIFPEIGLSQSTVSAYLSQLVRTNILTVRRDGTRKMYSLADSSIADLIKKIKRIASKLYE